MKNSSQESSHCFGKQTCLFQGDIGPVFGNGFNSAGAQLDPHGHIQLGNEDILLLQIRLESALDFLGDVTADPALFLGQTAAMNTAAGDGALTGDRTNSHKK